MGGDLGSQAFGEAEDLIYRQTRTNRVGLDGPLELSSASIAELAEALKHCAVPTKEVNTLLSAVEWLSSGGYR